jgi:pimeloyl-ACP methyl ester carboxylesterase
VSSSRDGTDCDVFQDGDNVLRQAEASSLWHYRQTGAGRPLILLHGIGMSHAAWNAVMPHLHMRQVTAFDIAGFGDSPSLPDGTPPTIANLVSALERSIQQIGIRLPVDMAGNSLGGAMALEAARRGMARKVVAISPAGLWATHDALHVRPLFGLLRFMAVNFPRVMKAALRRPWSRELALAMPISVGSRRMPVSDAL